MTSKRLVPAVPRHSLHPLHAPSTPVAIRSVTRHPNGLIPGGLYAPGFDDTCFLTTRPRRFTFVRLSNAHLPKVFLELSLQRSPPRLFTAAAWSGLGPAPESRSRGALPHLSRSCTTQISLRTDTLHVSLQHTVSRPAELHHRPLAEPSVRLSPHSAPIRQTCRSYRSASVQRGPRFLGRAS